MSKFSIERTYNENGSKCTGFEVYKDFLGFKLYKGHCSELEDAKKYARQQGASKIVKDW
jgi:hypothetical protein